jgi:hypothetical protein
MIACGRIPARPFREFCMSEMETKNEVEPEEFADELSDEALDRGQDEGKFCFWCANCVKP